MGSIFRPQQQYPGAKVNPQLTPRPFAILYLTVRANGVFADSEEQCFDQIKQLISFIPWNNEKKAEAFPKKTPKTRQYNIEDSFLICIIF